MALSANAKRNVKRIKAKLNRDYEPAVSTPTAGPVGSGKLFIGGQVFNGDISGVTQVVNVGRPAAAQYAAKVGGGTTVISGGGGSSSGTGTGTTVDLTALYGASYVMAETETEFTGYRKLAVSAALSLTDAGAGGALTIGMATPPTLSVSSVNNAANGSHAITSSSAPGAAASLLASDSGGNLTLPTFVASTSLTTPLITTATNTDLVINPAGTGAVQFPNDQTLRTSSFDSSFPITGWQINEVVGVSGYSALTIGKIQADELAVRVFVADEVRVDRGDEYWTKSYGIVAETFTTPSSIGGTVSVMFEDSPALAGAIFVNNDWVLIRKLDIDTGISLSNIWGQVATYVNNSDGTQNWTFTLRSGPTSESVTKGSLAIDFGASGAALIHLSVIDAAGAPYIKMRKWSGANPYTPSNFTTYVQLGELGSTGNSYYTPSGYGLYIRSTANEDQFMVADDNGFQIRGASFGLYNSTTQTILMNNAAGVNILEDVWGSWDNRRALQWWPDVSSMSGDPSLSIYTGKVNGGFTDDQNFSYIDANPTGGVLAGLSISAFGQGTANDALIYLEGGSQSLTTTPSVTITADAIDLVGTTTMDTGRADQFNPTSDLGADLGTAVLRWGTLYVDRVVVSGAISGSTMSGQEWEYAGDMTIDANSASNTTVSIVNQGAGSASLSVENNITVGGTVDGVDIASFESSYDSHVADSIIHHNRQHSITSSSDHTVTGSALDIVGLSSSNTLGILTPSSSPGAASAILKSDSSGILTLVQLTASTKLRTPTIDTASGNLSLAPAGGTVAVTGGLTATTSVSVPTVTTGSGNLSLTPAGGTVAVTGGLSATTSVSTPTVTTASGNLTLTSTGGTVSVIGALTASSTAIVTTSLSVPTVTTASGNLSLTPNSGTVAVTGAITATSTVTAANDTDAVNTLGRVKLGYAVATDTASFSHFDQNSSTGYALAQTAAGATSVNALTGQTLSLSNGGNAIATVGALGINMQSSMYVGSYDYASQATGWRVDALGGGDFRYLYADQMHVKSFIADLEQALAGGQIVSKSVAVIAEDFVVPFAGAAQILYVEDLPSAPNMAVFEANDIVWLRSFSRASGTLTVGNVYGAVSAYTNYADIQHWTFTRSGSTTYNTITMRGTAQSSTSSGATSRSVTKPTGVTTNDVLLAVVTHDGSPDVITASGWTELYYNSGTDINVGIYYKVAGGSEPSSYSFSTVSSHAIGAAVVAYYNVNTTSPIDDASIVVNAVGATMSGGSAWCSSTSGRSVFLGGVSNNTAVTPPAGMTEQIDTGSTGIRVYIADEGSIASGYDTNSATIGSSSYASIAATVILRPTYVSMTADAGAVAPGTTIASGSLALDLGISGNGYYEVTTVDGTYGANSPYSQVVTWTTHPQSGSVVRTRMGNLTGISGASAGEYGLYAGSGTIANTAQYLRVSTAGVQLNNVPLKLYNAGTQTVNIDSAGTDVWIGTSSSAKKLAWNGTSLSLTDSDIGLYSGANKMVGLNVTYGLDYRIGTAYTDEIPTITWRATAGTGNALARVAAYQTASETGMDIRVLPPDTSHDGAMSIVAYNNDLSNAAGIVFDTPASSTTTAALSIYGNNVEFVSNPLTVTLTHGDLDMNGNDIVNIGNIGAVSTWTPAITFGGGSTGLTYSSRTGRYTRVGKLIYASCEIRLSNKGSSTGAAKIGGLPATAASTAAGGVPSIIWYQMASNFVHVSGGVDSAATTITLVGYTAAAANYASLTHADFANNSIIQMTVMYEAA